MWKYGIIIKRGGNHVVKVKICFKCCFIIYSRLFFEFYFLESNNNQTINIYGTYVSDFSTLSVNHNLTYHYSYPFSNGRILKIDNNIYIFNDGEFNGYIAFFYDNQVKLVTTKHGGSIKIFTKSSATESDLSDKIS